MIPASLREHQIPLRQILGFGVQLDDSLSRSGRMTWVAREDELFAPEADAFVIANIAELSDAAIALLARRPTLHVLDDERNLTRFWQLLRRRRIVLTPLDAVCAAPRLLQTYPMIREAVCDHLATKPEPWIESGGRLRRLPPSLIPFSHLDKAQYTAFAERAGQMALPRVQHFWQALGAVGPFAPTLVPTATMVRVGESGPFQTASPTIVVTERTQTGALAAMSLRQSLLVVAPFALPLDQPIDLLLAEFAELRAEPFALHEVAVFGDRVGHTLGWLFAEYVV